MSDTVMATATFDCLLHHAHVINIRGETYRLKDRCKTANKRLRRQIFRRSRNPHKNDPRFVRHCDRNGSFEPEIVGKYSRNAHGMEEKILALYACGMSQRDSSEQIKNLYDVESSPDLVSKSSEKIMPEVSAWYPLVFLDAIYYKVKKNHQYVTKAA